MWRRPRSIVSPNHLGQALEKGLNPAKETISIQSLIVGGKRPVSVIDSKRIQVDERIKPRSVNARIRYFVDEGHEIMSPRISSSNRSDPCLETFLRRLLSMEAEDFVRKERIV